MRELAVAARAPSARLHGGYSGLIAPVSWIVNLVVTSKGRTAPALAKPSMDRLIHCIGEVVNQLSIGIPGKC